MLRRLAFSSLIGTVVVAAACSVYTAESPPASVGSDASSDGGVITSSDGSSSDATSEGDVDTRRFCEKLTTKPTYCRDFDDGAPASFGFALQHAPNGSSTSLDSTIASTPPGSLLVALPAGPIPQEAGLYVAQAKNEFNLGQAERVELGFDLRIDDLDVLHRLRTLTMCIPLPSSTGGFWCMWLESNGDQIIVREQEAADGGAVNRDHPVALPLPIGKWTRVEIAMDVGPASSFAMKIDGVTASTGGNFVIPTMPSATFGLDALIYGDQGDMLAGTKVRYDDVVINLSN